MLTGLRTFVALYGLLCNAQLHPMVRENLGSRDYTCPESLAASRNNFHFRGAALGGWLVLEPWITPSLFYQFLGAHERWGDEAPAHVGIDSLSFCTALGDEEANKQLRRHWRTWVTEKEIVALSAAGVDTVRIPVGDWMYVPYEPYIGCMDGALEELDRVLRLCEKHGLKALLDIHCARYANVKPPPLPAPPRPSLTSPHTFPTTNSSRGSQNGLDNSGVSDRVEWLSPTQYRHWELRSADWVGPWNIQTQSYDSINFTNVDVTLRAVEALVSLHKDDPVVVGMTPLNEPWYNTPLDVLKEFYWNSYRAVQDAAPHWVTLLHDSFRLRLEVFK